MPECHDFYRRTDNCLACLNVTISTDVLTIALACLNVTPPTDAPTSVLSRPNVTHPTDS